jgi:hypothetical protein
LFTAVQLQDSAGEEEDDELTLEGNRFGSLQMAVLQRSAVHPAYLILCLICCELSTVCLGLNVRRWARGDRLKGPRNRQKQPTDNCSAVNSAPSKDLNSIAKCCVIVQWRWLTIQATGYKNYSTGQELCRETTDRSHNRLCPFQKWARESFPTSVSQLAVRLTGRYCTNVTLRSSFLVRYKNKPKKALHVLRRKGPIPP